MHHESCDLCRDHRHEFRKKPNHIDCYQTSGILNDVHYLFNNCCGQIYKPKIFLKMLAMALSSIATIIMAGQFYLYFNRIGDVFTMIALGGGVLVSSALLCTHLLGCPSLEGEKLLLLIYGSLNSIIGILLLLENLYYALSPPYFFLAMATKAAGIVMLIDFARNKQNESND